MASITFRCSLCLLSACSLRLCLLVRLGSRPPVPGELVTGTIIADLSAPVSARGIDLTISGFEKVEWHEVSLESRASDPSDSDSAGATQQQQPRQKVHRHRGRKEFFKTKQRIYDIMGGVMMPVREKHSSSR